MSKKSLSIDDVLSGPAPEDDLPPGKAVIAINQTYSELSAAIAEHLPAGNLFRFYGEYVTINLVTEKGEVRVKTIPMTPARFVTWIEKFIVFVKNRAKDSPTTSISNQQASLILESDFMRDATPNVREISEVRLPVEAADSTPARRRYEPAPVGYNPDNEVYTVDLVKINWHEIYRPETVRRCLLQMFADFPLDDGSQPHEKCRSMGAIVCALLGQFLRHTIDLFPCVIFNANQQGTGKSFLARTILAPFYGLPGVVNYREDENEMVKELNSAVLAGRPYMFLDDLKSLVSNAINRFVTSPKIDGRILGKNSRFTVDNRSQYFITGNQLKTSRDVERRSLPIDMFCSMRATDRKISEKLSEAKILSLPWRADMLQALWSLVSGWMRAGCPRPDGEQKMTSFSSYMVASYITQWAGFMDPFGPRQVDLDTGDAMADALETVVIHIANQLQPDGPTHTGLKEIYTVPQIIEFAKAINLLDIVTNGARDENRSFGQQLRRIKGRVFEDSAGRQFEVGNRKTRACSAYEFTILSEPTRHVLPVIPPPDDDTDSDYYDPSVFD